jgi:hypothetical protein
VKIFRPRRRVTPDRGDFRRRHSITVAPAAKAVADAAQEARGGVRLPKSGRLSNQAISSRSATTSPMIVITGAESFSRATVSRSVASVATAVRWCGCVPHCTIAAGVSALDPPPMSASTIPGSVFTPM